MISANARDLFDKINSLPEFTGKVGLSLGGKMADPALAKVPLPAAWVVFQGDRPNDPLASVNPAVQAMLCSFSIFCYIPYGTQEDLHTQYDLLDTLVQAIRGKQAPNGSRWKLEGRSCRQIDPDRLMYEVNVSVVDVI